MDDADPSTNGIVSGTITLGPESTTDDGGTEPEDEEETVTGNAGDDVDDTGRHSGTLCQFHNGERRQGRFVRRFTDNSTTGCQSRCDFPGEHRIGEVPRCDAGYNANWLLNNNNSRYI